MQELFDAVDITGLSTNVSTGLVALLGVGLLFLGYKFVTRTFGMRK